MTWEGTRIRERGRERREVKGGKRSRKGEGRDRNEKDYSDNIGYGRVVSGVFRFGEVEDVGKGR